MNKNVRILCPIECFTFPGTVIYRLNLEKLNLLNLQIKKQTSLIADKSLRILSLFADSLNVTTFEESDSDENGLCSNTLSEFEEAEISGHVDRIHIRETSSDKYGSTDSFKKLRFFGLKKILTRLFTLKV